jgi:DNA-binding GntR family transcriptional regulator
LFLIDKNQPFRIGQIVFYGLKSEEGRNDPRMKNDALFKRAFNDTLDLLLKQSDGERLPSENALSAQLRVSRTTVRKVLSVLAERGVVTGEARERFVHPSRGKEMRFPEAETVSMSAQVEKRFMEWMLRDNASPGTAINELEMARQFGIATTGIREFLNRFQRFGLIEKRPNSGWAFKGFTPEFALELCEIREMFELRSARAFAVLPEDSAHWRQLEKLREEHLSLLEEIEERFHDFSDLDSRFHRLINAAAPNRFIDSFQDVITLIFHYHYQWNKRDERQRNEVAIREHLTYLEALLSRNVTMIELACRSHLGSARETLLKSTSMQETDAAKVGRRRRRKAAADSGRRISKDADIELASQNQTQNTKREKSI